MTLPSSLKCKVGGGGEHNLALSTFCFLMVVLEKTLKSPLDCKEMTSINPKGNQPCVFFGKTATKTEAQILAT